MLWRSKNVKYRQTSLDIVQMTNDAPKTFQ